MDKRRGESDGGAELVAGLTIGFILGAIIFYNVGFDRGAVSHATGGVVVDTLSDGSMEVVVPKIKEAAK